jgi:hypothetical protein
MSSKSLVIFEKASDFLLKHLFSENIFKKPRYFYKSLTYMIKSLQFSENVLKKPQLKIVQNMPYITGKNFNFSLNDLKKPLIF